MKVNPNSLCFIDDVAKKIFVSTLTEKFTTAEQFKSLASNSYYLATVLADQRESFLKCQGLQEEETTNCKQAQESVQHVHVANVANVTNVTTPTASKKLEEKQWEEPQAKLHKVKVDRAEKLERAERAERAEKLERAERAEKESFEPLRAVASSNDSGDIVQKRKRGRPPKVRTEASLPTKSLKKK